MNEKKKHKIMLGIEVVLFCMIVAILGTNAASSNPPSNGVSYGKNNQTTVEGALNDLYNKANYGNASASQILKGKTALVGGKKVTGTMEDRGSSTAVAQDKAWSYNGKIYFGVETGFYPSGTYGGMSGVSEKYITNASLAQAIGLTAGKLLKGQTVLGITGTGETSCPSFSSMFEGERFASGGVTDIQVYKYKNGEDQTPKTWNGWIALASSGGHLLDTDTKHEETFWDITSTWNIPIDNNFYQASKVKIKLINYNGTDDSLAKSGDSDFYTQVRYGWAMEGTGNDSKQIDNYIGIVPEITLYKNPNSWEVIETKSNIDWNRTQNKVVFNGDTNVLTDKSTRWVAGFTSNLTSSNTNLSLSYSNFKEERNYNYTGAKKFTRNADGSSTTTEDKWCDSSASDAYYYWGTNNTGKIAYYYKKDGSMNYKYDIGNLVLRARYNHWMVSMDFYK